MSLGSAGLGGAGLAEAGIGLGGAGLEGGAVAAPAVADPDITAYSLTSAAVPFTIVANNHLSPTFSLSGDRVYWARASSFQSFQYELTTPGDLSTLTGNFEGAQNWAINTQNMRSIALNPARTKAYKMRRASGSGDSFVSADPFSAVALGDPAQNPYALTNTVLGTGLVSPLTPRDFVAAANDLDLYVASYDIADRRIYHFQMSVAGDASTAVAQGAVLDLTSKFATFMYGIAYTPDGSKLFILGDDGGTLKVVQYDLSPAYDVTSAVDASKEITVTPAFFSQVSSNLSLAVWENPAGGFKLYLTWHDLDNFNGANMEFDLYEASSGAVTDPDFASVVLLLDFAGADGAQDISDLSNAAHNNEVFNQVGLLEVDTAQQFLGENTLLLDPTSGPVLSGGSNNRVEYPNDVDWQFGTGEFTVELGLRFVNNSIRQNIISSFNTAMAQGWSLQWFTGQMLVWVANAPILISAAWVPNVGQFYHLAVSRVSGTTRMFIDGVEFGSAVDATNYAQGAPLALGVLTNNSTANFFPVDGNIGAVRVTKGVGRYAANFTPPTAFFPTS